MMWKGEQSGVLLFKGKSVFYKINFRLGTSVQNWPNWSWQFTYGFKENSLVT